MDDEPVMIDDARVLAVEIRECGEPLVDLRTYGLRSAEDHPRASSPAATRFWCRTSVAERLVDADAALDVLDLVVTEAHRPLELQRHYWESDLATLRRSRPDLTADEAMHEAAKYVAPPWNVPPHTTGGAVDVILMRNDHELDMGCALNEQCDAMRTNHPGLRAEDRRNRQMLGEAMLSAGFVNYGHEWWHYSYGDQYWAHATGSTAIYASL